MTFDDAFNRLIGYEQGYSNDKNDPGGETNWGVTWPTLRQAIEKKIVPASVTIKTLTREQSKTIYKELFWNAIKADRLHDGVAFQTFDFAVNSSIEIAIRYLQRAVGVADDGIWGPVSQKAVDQMTESDTIMRLNAERLEFMSKLKAWFNFNRGWARRIAQNLRYGAIDS